MKVLRFDLSVLFLATAAVAACSSPAPSPTPSTQGPSPDASSGTGADASSETSNSEGGTCHLAAGNPGTLTVTGTACGAAVSYTSPAQLTIDVEPASFTTLDSGSATYIEIGDGDPTGNPQASGYFDSHDVYLNLSVGASFDYSGANTSPVTSGVLEGCGFGAMAFGAGSIAVTFNGTSVQAHADNLPVTAFDPGAFGSLQVTACTGTVSLQFQGPYTKKL